MKALQSRLFAITILATDRKHHSVDEYMVITMMVMVTVKFLVITGVVLSMFFIGHRSRYTGGVLPETIDTNITPSQQTRSGAGPTMFADGQSYVFCRATRPAARIIVWKQVLLPESVQTQHHTTKAKASKQTVRFCYFIDAQQ